MREKSKSSIHPNFSSCTAARLPQIPFSWEEPGERQLNMLEKASEGRKHLWTLMIMNLWHFCQNPNAFASKEGCCWLTGFLWVLSGSALTSVWLKQNEIHQTSSLLQAQRCSCLVKLNWKKNPSMWLNVIEEVAIDLRLSLKQASSLPNVFSGLFFTGCFFFFWDESKGFGKLSFQCFTGWRHLHILGTIFSKNMFLSVAQGSWNTAACTTCALILQAAAATGGKSTLWRSRGQCADSRAEKARMQDCVGVCQILTQLWKHTVIWVIALY